MKKVDSLKENTNLDSLLGDLGGIGVVKERAYIECYIIWDERYEKIDERE